MTVTCPTCGKTFDTPNPISQAGGRQGGKARNPRKGFGSWSKARWKRYKTARKAASKHLWTTFVTGDGDGDGSQRFCEYCGESQVKTKTGWKTMPDGHGIHPCDGMKGGAS